MLTTTVDSCTGRMSFVNLHHFDIPPVFTNELASAASTTTPTIWAGDWNFPPGGAPTLRPSRTHNTSAGTAQIDPPAFATEPGQTPVSDHAPVITTFESKRRPPASQRPIPGWVVRHPLYAINATSLLRRVPADAAPVDRWRRKKKLLRPMAAPISRTARAQLAVQVVRAHHCADTSSLRAACRRWPGLVAMASRDRHSVSSADAQALTELLASTILAAPCTDAFDTSQAVEPDSRLRTDAGSHTTRSCLRLWLPFAQRPWLVVVAPTPPTGIAADAASPSPAGPMPMATALKDFWAPHFQRSGVVDRPRRQCSTHAQRSLCVFIPAGRCAYDLADSGDRTRPAEATCPLILKNSDGQCIESMGARPTDVALRREAPPAKQRD